MSVRMTSLTEKRMKFLKDFEFVRCHACRVLLAVREKKTGLYYCAGGRCHCRVLEAQEKAQSTGRTVDPVVQESIEKLGELKIGETPKTTPVSKRATKPVIMKDTMIMVPTQVLINLA